MAQFTYSGYSQEVVFGRGAVDQLGELVGRYGWKRVLFCTSGSQQRSGNASRLETALGERLAATFSGVMPHVQEEQVNEATELAQSHDVDVIVALGGGSVIGIAKAVSDALHEAKHGYPAREAPPLEPPAVPTIAIPITYAGSEMTTVYGVTRDVNGVRRKMTVSGRNIVPRLVVYDPELTVDLPKQITGTSAMNAIAHCVEALYSLKRNPLSTAAAIGSMRAFHDGLPAYARDNRSIDARARLLEGAFLAGSALSQVAMAIHHGVCHVLGGTAGVSHGVANTIVLPHAMRFNRDAAADVLAPAAVAMGLASQDADPKEATNRLIDWIEEMQTALDLPARLRDADVPKDSLPKIAQIAFDGGPVKNNPRPIREPGEIEAFLREMW